MGLTQGDAYYKISSSEWEILTSMGFSAPGIEIGNFVYISAGDYDPTAWYGIGADGYFIYMKSTQLAG